MKFHQLKGEGGSTVSLLDRVFNRKPGPVNSRTATGNRKGNLPLDERLEAAMAAFVSGKEHGFVLAGLAAEDPEISAVVLHKKLVSDLNGPYGRAAAVAIKKLPDEYALPLVRDAFKSRYAAVRYYAAESISLRTSSKAVELARDLLQSETDEGTVSLLNRLVKK
jgi:hypothetical protein